MFTANASDPHNRLLSMLPTGDLERLRPLLTTVRLHPRQVLHKQGEQLDYVYFPNSGIISMTTVFDDGAMLEAATIGDEGVVGIEAFFTDTPVAPCETIVQVPTPHESAEMMHIADFRRELFEHRPLSVLVASYTDALHAQIVRLTACNAHHNVHQRCARWLLTAHDHMHGHDFHLSQEFLAVMLGVRRQSVSEVAGAFRTAGLIRYTHGHIAIANRAGLEVVSCECYTAIRSRYQAIRAFLD
jgi:CRP-like cAMP-binding protein